MITAAARPLLASTAAVAAAGALVLAPVQPPAATAPPTVPSVHVEEIALAGIGQDIYYAITPVVQYAVGGVSYLINFLPLIGGPTAAQININYFQGIQPIIEATVNYLAAVVQNPFGIVASTSAYAGSLYDIGYNWVSAELVFFGLQPLPPLPQIAAAERTGSTTGRAPASAAAQADDQAKDRAEDQAGSQAGPRIEVSVTPGEDAENPADPAGTTADAEIATRTGAGERGRAVRPAADDARRPSGAARSTPAVGSAGPDGPTASAGERKRGRAAA